jgi:hypothetical protein
MCSKCAELDLKLDYCRSVAARPHNALEKEGIAMLIESLCEEKSALHSDVSDAGFYREDTSR